MHKSAKNDLERFLREDIGKVDITSRLLPRKKISATIISRQIGIIAGVEYAKKIFLSRNCRVKIYKKDGQKVSINSKIMTITGNAYSILSCERTALNLMSRMSGIATKTSMFVQKIKETNSNVKLFSTRKTAPGLRIFDKDAVEIGGGNKHRISLDQMYMIKDNHIAASNSLTELVHKAKKHHKRIEVEVENLQDAFTVAQEGADIIMLDNMSPSKLVKIINALKQANLRKKIKIEASGGIDASNIKQYAKTGVDMISVGKLTNSVQGLDLSLEVN